MKLFVASGGQMRHFVMNKLAGQTCHLHHAKNLICNRIEEFV